MAYLSNIEKILANWLGAGVDEDAPQSRIEELLIQIRDSGGSGGTSDYEELSKKPSINNVVLLGNKSLDDLGVTSAINSQLGGLSLVQCTQAEYDAMSEHDSSTLYIVVNAGGE